MGWQIIAVLAILFGIVILVVSNVRMLEESRRELLRMSCALAQSNRMAVTAAMEAAAGRSVIGFITMAYAGDAHILSSGDIEGTRWSFELWSVGPSSADLWIVPVNQHGRRIHVTILPLGQVCAFWEGVFPEAVARGIVRESKKFLAERGFRFSNDLGWAGPIDSVAEAIVGGVPGQSLLQGQW
jgi:hypothetical protein